MGKHKKLAEETAAEAPSKRHGLVGTHQTPEHIRKRGMYGNKWAANEKYIDYCEGCGREQEHTKGNAECDECVEWMEYWNSLTPAEIRAFDASVEMYIEEHANDPDKEYYRKRNEAQIAAERKRKAKDATV